MAEKFRFRFVFGRKWTFTFGGGFVFGRKRKTRFRSVFYQFILLGKQSNVCVCVKNLLRVKMWSKICGLLVAGAAIGYSHSCCQVDIGNHPHYNRCIQSLMLSEIIHTTTGVYNHSCCQVDIGNHPHYRTTVVHNQSTTRESNRLSERSVLLPTSMMSTSEPRSVLTSSIHLDVCWNELASARPSHATFSYLIVNSIKISIKAC